MSQHIMTVTLTEDEYNCVQAQLENRDYLFHDDIADKAGMALMASIGMISLAMRDMFLSGGNGKNGKS